MILVSLLESPVWGLAMEPGLLHLPFRAEVLTAEGLGRSLWCVDSVFQWLCWCQPRLPMSMVDDAILGQLVVPEERKMGSWS